MKVSYFLFVLLITSSLCANKKDVDTAYINSENSDVILIYVNGDIEREYSTEYLYFKEYYTDSFLTNFKEFIHLVHDDTVNVIYDVVINNQDSLNDGYEHEMLFISENEYDRGRRVLIADNFSKSKKIRKYIEAAQEYYSGDSSIINTDLELITNLSREATNFMVPYNLYKRVKYSKTFGIGHGYCEMKYFDNKVVILEYFVNGDCNIVKNQRFRVDDPDFNCPKILTDEYSFTAVEENVFVTKKSLKTDFQEIDTIAIWEKQVLSK